VRRTRKPKPNHAIEVVILAGGASSRMGRDKARTRVGGRTLLQHVRAAARATGWPVRVLRHDAVPKCGPLGGVLTALRDVSLFSGRSRRKEADSGSAFKMSLLTSAPAHLTGVLVFLSCDMPFVSEAMVRRVAMVVTLRRIASFFVDKQGRAGFPFALHVTALAAVQRQINHGRLSLQELAYALGARRLPIQQRESWRWFNVNTPADLAQARRIASAKPIASPKQRR
jgi:molybdopterin-guanine dinucleotide biosynthesis protein A